MPSDGGGVYAMRRRYRQTRRAGFSCRVRKPDSNSSSTSWWWCGANGSFPAEIRPHGLSAPRLSTVFQVSIGCFFFL